MQNNIEQKTLPEDLLPGQENIEQEATKEPHLLEIRDLAVQFYSGKKAVHAVDGVSYHVDRGEVLGVVGESGSGKSVTAMTVMRLLPSAKVTNGEVLFKGENLLQKNESAMTHIRGNQVSMIFQEPMTSLNPVYTIGSQIVEAIRLHQKKNRQEARKMAIHLLKEVGIAFPEKRIHEYPHQMSGGMLQRAMIAMALSCNPELLIADEPTTALDVTIQAQILDLIQRLKEERDMSIIMITHDLGVVAEVAKRVAVMYMGQIVEEATVHDIFREPLHPYTQGLLRSIPKLGNYERLYMIPNRGAMGQKPAGCRFCPRCEYAMGRCAEEEPRLTPLEDGRKVRCWLWQPNQEEVAENNQEGDGNHA